jgi:hypothetical protein
VTEAANLLAAQCQPAYAWHQLGALAAAKDGQTDDRRRLGKGHRRDACGRGPGRGRPVAGIDPAALEAPAARLPSEKISRLWELAAERSGNPAIGLAQHYVVRPASFDAVGYAMMSCADLRGA